jgi:alkylation response protein AidB-like acyl-CoA dehydrogenase
VEIFSLNKDQVLITTNGFPVLGERGSEIPLTGSKIAVGANGSVMVDGAEVDQIAVVTFSDLNALRKEGYNLLKMETGKEEIKLKHLPKICTGEYPAGSFALTEPHTGSDAANIRTSAVRKNDNYILNGSKTLITSGEVSGVTVVWAVTEKNFEKRKGDHRFRR